MLLAKALVPPARRALLAAALLLPACGPVPQAPPPDAPAPQTIYVILGEPPPDTAPDDIWIPDDPGEGNPFSRVRVWSGAYDCAQGTTDLTFRVLGVQGPLVRAVFEFDHVDSGAVGSYLVLGTYDPATRAARFTPGAWLQRPEGYVSVGMTGDVADDASLFAGRIDHATCGAFRLRPAR